MRSPAGKHCVSEIAQLDLRRASEFHRRPGSYNLNPGNILGAITVSPAFLSCIFTNPGGANYFHLSETREVIFAPS